MCITHFKCLIHFKCLTREAERHAKQVVVSPSVISSKGYASRQSRGIELIRAAKEPRRRPGKKHKLPHVRMCSSLSNSYNIINYFLLIQVLPEFQIPKCLTDTSLGRPQGLAETNNFKFPHITPHHGYTSGLRSGLHTQAPSKKGTDVGSFLPALYTDNTAKVFCINPCQVSPCYVFMSYSLAPTVSLSHQKTPSSIPQTPFKLVSYTHAG